MYELSILGALMSRDMSGYKLRQVLGSNLVPRREISNGVMYPVLQQLQHKGYITMSLAENSPRHEKVAHITDIGQKHFYALMAAPVPVDAKRESVYLFKSQGEEGELVLPSEEEFDEVVKFYEENVAE